VRVEIQISWEKAFKGGNIRVNVSSSEAVTIKIPPGCQIGKTWRRKGKGRYGRPPGDLIIKLVKYSDDVPWSIKGLNVHMTKRVTFHTIYARQAVMIASPWGKEYTLYPDFEEREPTRIKGAGVKKGNKKGDMIIDWIIIYPQRGNPRLASVLREMQGTR